MSTTANGGPASVRRVVMTGRCRGRCPDARSDPVYPRRPDAGRARAPLVPALRRRHRRHRRDPRHRRALSRALAIIRRPRQRPTHLDELPQRIRAINRLVTRAGWDAAGFELELRPILRAIAAQRLATYRTIDIDTDPRRREPFWESGSGRC